jgi:hypothetical protein
MRTWCVSAAVLGVALSSWSGVMPAAAAQQAPQGDQAQNVLTALKAALGGDAKLGALKTLSAEGSERRVMGETERTSDIELFAVFPDHLQRIEQFQLPTGMPGPRVAQTVNGEEFWAGALDPMPGGMMMFGGPGGPGGGQGGPGVPGGQGGQGGQGGNRQGGNRMSPKGDLLRTFTGILPVSSALPTNVTFTYAGEAKSNDGGAADVLDVKSPDFEAKLFVDQQTHLPLMMTYQGPDPAAMAARMRTFQRREGETQEQQRARMAEEREKMASQPPPPPPPMVEYQAYFSEYKTFDGLMLPTRISRAVKGTTTQEMEIKKYKINPKIDLSQFQKKGS